MGLDDVSDGEEFQPRREPNELLGEFNFDDEPGVESDEETPSQAQMTPKPFERSSEKANAERSLWGMKSSDIRRIPLSTRGTDIHTPMYSPKTSFIAIDEFDEDNDVLMDSPETQRRKSSRKKAGFGINNDELSSKATSLLSRMESAAANDLDNNQKRQPAIEKLKMLNEVEEACTHKDMQPLLMREGLLGVLKSWIEPLTDGTLPNVKIRETVLKILLKLPIDTSDPTQRKTLKISEIGSRVMFLSRISDETLKNKRMAFELVQRWVRPIFEEARRYDEEDRVHEALTARKRRLDTEKAEEDRKRISKHDDPDNKYVVRRPKPNWDYVIKPKGRIDLNKNITHKKSSVLQKLNRFKRNQKRNRM